MRRSAVGDGSWNLEYSLRLSDIAQVLVQNLFGANWYTHCLVKELLLDIFQHYKNESATGLFSTLLCSQMNAVVSKSNFPALSFVKKFT